MICSFERPDRQAVSQLPVLARSNFDLLIYFNAFFCSISFPIGDTSKIHPKFGMLLLKWEWIMNLLLKVIGFSSLLLLINDLCLAKIESRLRVGKTINVFVRYGYLGISMKVISYNDTERWLFKEPTNNVFKVSMLLLLFFFSYLV